jgi:hypothetical protein
LIFRATEYPVIRSLMPNAQAGAEMLRLHAADPLGPDAIRAYFQQLYWRIGPGGSRPGRRAPDVPRASW